MAITIRARNMVVAEDMRGTRSPLPQCPSPGWLRDHSDPRLFILSMLQAAVTREDGWLFRVHITGKFFEYADWRAFRRLTDNVSDEQVVASMRATAAEAVRFGVTSIQNMTFVSPERYVALLRQAQLPLRVRVIRWPPTDTHARDLKDGRTLPRHPPGAPLVTVSGTKWILDGAPIERGMAVRTPYVDRAGWRGSLLFPPAAVEAMLRESIANQGHESLVSVPGRPVEKG